MTRFLFLLLAVCPTVVCAQSVRLNWAEDNSRCWFERKGKDGTEFVIVSTNVANRNMMVDRAGLPAFDRVKLAAAISKKLEKSIEPAELNVDRIAFAASPEKLFIQTKGKSWLVDLKTYELEEKPIPAAKAKEARLFMPPRRSGGSDESTNITIENRLKDSIELFWIGRDRGRQSYGTIKPGDSHQQHTYVGHVWLVQAGDLSGCFSARAGDRVVIDEAAFETIRRERPSRRGGRRSPNRIRPSASSPDGKWRITAKDHNLWLKGDADDRQLTEDGTEKNSFSRNGRAPSLMWSPDSQYVVAFQTKQGTERTVYLVESAPRDQLQPKLQNYNYRKPGDDLDVQAVHLFSVEDGKEIPVSHDLFSNPWSLRFTGWSESGDRFYLYYNQRGHQVLRLLEVSVASGEVRTVVEETSDTFIQYSDRGKSVFEDLSDDDFLWASERTGWNHLYRYSRSKRALLNAVTSGEWNVKRIEKIDRDTKQIWFYAVGVHENQDPYHEHLCRVNFDGSDLKVLTRGDGTHRVQFERDDNYLIDTFSRVDLAPITELLDAETGTFIAELSRQDTKARFGKRRVTERFVAKGRDGKTDIWGIIHWPIGFDPTFDGDGTDEPIKKYPVVENIYAGPHDHHVPKSFRTRYGHQHRIADAGMIVVQIDGMGTAWRSKAFHDVCHKNLRDAGFPDRIAWMKAAAKKYPQMDLSRVGIYGGSAGGQNAMAALLWHNDFYKVAVADCGCHDNRMDKIWWNEQWMGWPIDDSYKKNSNMENAHLLEGDLMLIVGELDRNVDPASTTQVVSKLVKANKDFEFVLVPGTGHGSAETPWASRKRLNFLREKLRAD